MEQGGPLIQCGWCTQEKREFWRLRHTERRQPCDDGGRDWSNVFTSQGMPKIAGKHQEKGEARKNSPLQISQGAQLSTP